MDTSHLATQVTTIIAQLHSLFDDIGVPSHERESREAKLFAALSETLNGQLRTVTSEKDELTAEARRIIKTIRQMEASLIDEKPRESEYGLEDDRLKVTVPLMRCIQGLKEEHSGIAKLHRERFEQVKKLVEALESYSSHLEPSFLKVSLPPQTQGGQVPPTFDLSPSYIASLDEEFGRVYEEYVRRLDTVKALSEGIVSLWAELGIPQAQTDSSIVKHYRDSPEQLGLHSSDITRLQSRYDKLSSEKASREQKLQDMKVQMEALWDRLGVEDMDRKRFLAGTRGCGLRVINEFEAELDRLNELKRQNLGLFVEDARCRLQDLWDVLYFSEEEMLDFTPAFSDVYSDALLSAHEDEIDRLTNLKEQRLPLLQLVEKHRTLVKEREELAASSQDASRLIAKKGEKRDPGKLLREEKMRKRITKELPKVEAELRKKLESWENDYGRPFLVHGQDYLLEMEAVAEASRPAASARSRTPGVSSMPSKGVKATPAAASRTAPGRSAAKPSAAAAPSRPKTPGLVRPATAAGNRAAPSAAKPSSPSKLPRAPLSPMKNGNNSPERRPPTRAEPSRQNAENSRPKMGPPARAPPPKMRDLGPPPPPASRSHDLPPPTNASYHSQHPPHPPLSSSSSAASGNDNWRCESAASSHSHGSVARHGHQQQQQQRPQNPHQQQQHHHSHYNADSYDDPYSDTHSRAEKMSYAPPSLTSGTSASGSSHGGSSHHPSYSYDRHAGGGGGGGPQFRTVSGDTLSSHAASGSENWETYDDEGVVVGAEYDQAQQYRGHHQYGSSNHHHPQHHPNQQQHLSYDLDADYYAKLRAATGSTGTVGAPSKRPAPDAYDSATLTGAKGRKLRQIYDGLTHERTYVEDAQGRLVSASDAGWTDEDAF